MIGCVVSDNSEDDVPCDVRGRISSKVSLDEEDNPVISDWIMTCSVKRPMQFWKTCRQRQVDLIGDDCVRCVF